MGIELGLIQMPWLTNAFFQWLNGASITSLIGSIEDGSKLFPSAMPIPGWSHVWAWIMKKFVYRYHKWPEILISIRLDTTAML